MLQINAKMTHNNSILNLVNVNIKFVQFLGFTGMEIKLTVTGSFFSSFFVFKLIEHLDLVKFQRITKKWNRIFNAILFAVPSPRNALLFLSSVS